MNYKEVCKRESIGGDFTYGIKVDVALTRNLTESEFNFIEDKVEEIKKMILTTYVRSDPERMENARIEKAKLLACFSNEVYVKEIPNGYCNDWCCSHRPWFIVTTKIGPVEIGWRKRVISISWKGTDVKQNAQEIFPHEDTTKEGQLIHAWSYEKATEYIKRLLEFAK